MQPRRSKKGPLKREEKPFKSFLEAGRRKYLPAKRPAAKEKDNFFVRGYV